MTEQSQSVVAHQGVVPHLVVEGAADAIEFYKTAFGATEVMRLAGALEAVFGEDGEEPSQLLASLATALTDVRSAIASWRRSN